MCVWRAGGSAGAGRGAGSAGAGKGGGGSAGATSPSPQFDPYSHVAVPMRRMSKARPQIHMHIFRP